MSLILDALNRAEHERKNKQAVPDLNTIHSTVAGSPPPASHQPLIIILVAVIVVLLSIVCVFWLVPMFSSFTTTKPLEASTQTNISTTTHNVASTPVSLPAVEHQSSQQNTQVITTPVQLATVTPAVENLYAEQMPAAPTQAADVEQLYAPDAVEPMSESVVTPFATSDSTSTAMQNVLANEPVTPAPQTISQSTKPIRHFADVNEIDFNDLPWNQRQQIPTISYSRHNYLPNNVSTVMINGETVGEGNSLAGGQLVVDEIFVDGVVLNFRGNKFKLRALSGWVNM